MAKNYESESKTNKNSTGTSGKNCKNSYGNEMNSRNENKYANEISSRNESGSDASGKNARNKSQNKASQSYNSEGTSSRY